MSGRQAALAAATDQNLAAVQERARNLPRPVAKLAGTVAELILAEFPGQEELAGRVLMSAASSLGGVADQMRERGHPLEAVSTLNLLALAAGQVYREGAVHG